MRLISRYAVVLALMQSLASGYFWRTAGKGSDNGEEGNPL
jgi:hypothetical protein